MIGSEVRPGNGNCHVNPRLITGPVTRCRNSVCSVWPRVCHRLGQCVLTFARPISTLPPIATGLLSHCVLVVVVCQCRIYHRPVNVNNWTLGYDSWTHMDGPWSRCCSGLIHKVPFVKPDKIDSQCISVHTYLNFSLFCVYYLHISYLLFSK